ncbi:hypothetical protein ACIQZO_32475 [Streptomyces sp. NPDC097617]|uniref:hypothetical protein n=1 Tax=Streptomyces sp. NPDC097617 TaxID=3366091 RepID=UPI00381AE734
MVVAASHVKSDAAIRFLSQFATHPAIEVRSQLLWAWSRFECAAYAEDVISKLDPLDLRYSIRSDEQLRQLERLRPRPSSLDVRSEVSLPALAGYAGRHGLTELILAHPTVPDLDFLKGQSALQQLALDNCPELTDLCALGGLPIRRLGVRSVRPDVGLDVVAGLGELEQLALSGPAGMTWSPQALPTRAPLVVLLVSGAMAPAAGLKGLGAVSGLTHLGLNVASSPASEADWREIGELRSLHHLTVSAASFAFLPPAATLPSVADLTLIGYGEDRCMSTAIDRLDAVFPRLDRWNTGEAWDFSAE